MLTANSSTPFQQSPATEHPIGPYRTTIAGGIHHLTPHRKAHTLTQTVSPMAAQSIYPTQVRPIGYRLGRIGRSDLFAWLTSTLLHVAVFGTLYTCWSQDANIVRRDIIPEARFAAAPGPVTPPSGKQSLKLAQVPLSTPKPTLLSPPDELPVSAAPRDEWPDLILPIQQPPRPEASHTAGPVGESTAVAPLSAFFGQAGNAYRVVYIVDLSASVATFIDSILAELTKSIKELIPAQRFNIVMAEPEGRVTVFIPGRIVPANGKYKREATEFIDRYIGYRKPGPVDPIKAMQAAFAPKPELIYFLTDGLYENLRADLLRELRHLNADHAVKITTLGFDPSPIAKGLLEQIARRHGGHCRMVEPNR